MHHPPPAEAPGTSGVLQQLTLASFGTQAPIQALATDPFGNVYAAGATAGSSFSPAPAHVFLAKVTADGAIVWTTHLGGSNQDQLAAIAADYQGNLYVTGTTHSPDFPTTLPPIGAPGQQAVFVTKYSTGGTPLWSVRIGGSAANSANALAVDSAGSVYVTGGTSSSDFPVTPGVLDGSLGAGPSAAFLTKLNPDGSLAWSTFLTAGGNAVVVDSAGQPAVAGGGEIPGVAPPPQGLAVMRLDRNASQVIASTYIPGSGFAHNSPDVPKPLSTPALATGPDGSLYLVAESEVAVTPGSYNAPQPATLCSSFYYWTAEYLYVTPNAFVAKLAASDLHPVYTAMLRASCGLVPGAVAVDATGAAVVAMYASDGLALHNPLLISGTGSALAKLSPDGSRLEFATYLEGGGIPGLALAADGSIYAGVTQGFNGYSGLASVLHIPIPNPPISLDGIANAFSGETSAVANGGLYTLTGTGFQPAAANLGLNQNLPASLNGVEVTFDGVRAPILQTGAGVVTAVAPPPRGGSVPAFTAVQLRVNGLASNPVWLPLAASLPGLRSDVYNQDGYVNDAAHPAPVGSTVTVYATGMGATNPPLAPGSVAAVAESPATHVYTSWDDQIAPTHTSASTVLGFLSSVFQVQVQIPAAAKYHGAPAANGVVLVSIALDAAGNNVPRYSNSVNIYIQ